MRRGASARAHPGAAVHLAPARPPLSSAQGAGPVCACRGRTITRSAAPSRATAAARPPAWARHGDRGRDGRHRGSDRIGREPAGDRGGDPGAEGGTVIGPTGAVRVMMATRPVDFRKGADGLAALVRETMGADPFSGAVYVFRAKRAHRTSFRIPFRVRAHRLPLASPLWASPAGRTAHDAQSG